MKGVVRPQAMPTRRKPRIQFRIEGEGLGGGGVAVEDIFGVDGGGGGQGASAGRLFEISG